MPTGTRIRTDNVFGTTTDNPLLVGATTFNSAGLANLAAVASNHAIVVLDPLRSAGAPEIVIVTAHTAAATSATITRGAYGTTARQHAAGTLWVHAPTKEDVIQVLTSATRPADPYQGQLIYETDTDSYVGRGAGAVWQTVMTMGAWTAYTPTLVQSGAVTKTVTYAKYMRIGRLITANVFLDVTGAGTGANAVVLGLPVASAVPTNGVLGTGYVFDASVPAFYGGVFRMAGTNVTGVFASTSTDVNPSLGAAVFTAALASGDIVSAHFAYEATS